jgi:hypothetical protein
VGRDLGARPTEGLVVDVSVGVGVTSAAGWCRLTTRSPRAAVPDRRIATSSEPPPTAPSPHRTMSHDRSPVTDRPAQTFPSKHTATPIRGD